MQVVAWPLSPLLQSELKPAVAVTGRSRCNQRPGAVTARPRAMQADEKPFKEYWASTVFPSIKDAFERLQGTPPTRIADRAQKDQVEKDTKEREKGPKERKVQKKEKKDPVHEKISRTLDEGVGEG